MNSNQKFYSEEMKNYVMKTCREYINFFGYSKIEGKENPTAYFEYPALSDDEINNAGTFTVLNEEQLAWYCAEKEILDKKTHTINKVGDGIQIKLNDEPLIKFQKLRYELVI